MRSHGGELAMQVVKSLAAAHVHGADAGIYAMGAFKNGQAIRDAIEKSAVSAVDPTGTLVPDAAAYDFAEYIRPQTIIGKLVGLRRAPTRVRCSIVASGGASAEWISISGGGISVSAAALAGTMFDVLRVSAISVLTKEVAASTLPAAEQLMSRDLTGAMVQAMDSSFINPSNGGTSNAEPAAVTYGAPATVASGSSLSAVDADLGGLQEALSNAGSDMQFAAWVLQPRTALFLSRLRGSGGALAHPNISVKGGTLLGLPVIVSAAYPDKTGSPSERSISLIDPSRIVLVDDGAGSFAVSDKVSLQMDGATSQKAGATATGTSVVSMFQAESIAIKAVRHANWKVLGAAGAAAQVLSGVTY